MFNELFGTDKMSELLTKPVFWIMIIVVILLVQLIQELGLAISKKLDKRRILQ